MLVSKFKELLGTRARPTRANLTAPRDKIHLLREAEEYDLRSEWVGHVYGNLSRFDLPKYASGLLILFGKGFKTQNLALTQTLLFVGETQEGCRPHSRDLALDCAEFTREHLLIFNAFFSGTPISQPIPVGLEITKGWHNKEAARFVTIVDQVRNGVGVACWWQRR